MGVLLHLSGFRADFFWPYSGPRERMTVRPDAATEREIAMPCLKLTVRCLVATACALLLAAVPQEATAEGICSQLKKQGKSVPARGCVNATDVRKNSLKGKDMKNEAGVNFAQGKSFDRSPPIEKTVYASVVIVAPGPGFGYIVVTAYVALTTFVPQRLGGALACNIVIAKSPGFETPSPGPTVSGSVMRGVKWAETMLWTDTIRVDPGVSKFNLVCWRLDAPQDSFGANSFITAEFYPRQY